MPKKSSKYIVRFQVKEGVDEAICRHPKFAQKKLSQFGNVYPKKTITVIISGTDQEEKQKFKYRGEDWQKYVDRI